MAATNSGLEPNIMSHKISRYFLVFTGESELEIEPIRFIHNHLTIKCYN
jgi:hypothetical protein